ncbi:hypothetical protein C6T66_24250 [Burkholderia multivorans]|uniref:Uncharacterized protein n=1 Tax=Burkholderia multivorans TaxID=87883 RepID=A0A8E2RW55_9BURK|nr:hypothetical protein C6P76_24380 [Burkholderia multivorans]PRF24190.1 hypothetical protein C6P98_13060 [Burkholderia multivorans]PRG82254.1 hypothetical protein C6T66_24250 [Burkholderia multivorans]
MPACRYLGPSHLDVSVVASAWSLRKTPEKYCPSAIACESRTLRAVPRRALRVPATHVLRKDDSSASARAAPAPCPSAGSRNG